MANLTTQQLRLFLAVKQYCPTAEMHITPMEFGRDYVQITWNNNEEHYLCERRYQARIGPRGAFEIYYVSGFGAEADSRYEKTLASLALYDLEIEGSIRLHSNRKYSKYYNGHLKSEQGIYKGLPTMKKLNQYLGALLPHFELVKGNGYFYFSHRPDAPTYSVVPESIHICHLNHMSGEDWTKTIKYAVEEWKHGYSTEEA